MQNFIHVAQNINVEPILKGLDEHPELWNQINLRTTHPGTTHYNVDDILIRFNELDKDVVDEPENVWYPAAFILDIKPLIYALMNDVFGDRLGRCVITRLKPGDKIDPHVDHGSPVSYYQRFHISLLNDEGAVFKCGEEEFTPRTGDVYAVANHKEHSVENNSKLDRLTMIVDIRTPFFENLKKTYEE